MDKIQDKTPQPGEIYVDKCLSGTFTDADYVQITKTAYHRMKNEQVQEPTRTIPDLLEAIKDCKTRKAQKSSPWPPSGNILTGGMLKEQTALRTLTNASCFNPSQDRLCHSWRRTT